MFNERNGVQHHRWWSFLSRNQIERKRTTLERSRGASSWVYVNESSRRSHFLETSAADKATKGTSQQKAKSDIALSDDTLFDNRMMRDDSIKVFTGLSCYCCLSWLFFCEGVDSDRQDSNVTTDWFCRSSNFLDWLEETLSGWFSNKVGFGIQHCVVICAVGANQSLSFTQKRVEDEICTSCMISLS